MYRLLILPSLVLCLLAGGAFAGPWPRPPGEAFGTISREIRDGGDWTALYGEYGWSERLTVVLDAGQDALDDDWIALIGVRMPLWETGRHRFAVTFGAGMERASYEIWGVDDKNGTVPAEYADRILIDEGDETRAVMQTGISWGTGLETRLGPGWATVDAVMRQTLDGTGGQNKLDGTVGVNLSDRRAVYGQAQYSDEKNAATQLRLGLGWVEHFGPVALEAGIGKRLRAGREADAKIGLWFTF